MHANRNRRRGFTFLELIVVTIIIAVLSAAVLPVFSTSFRSLRVRNAKADLLATLAHTQECAVRDSREYRFYVDQKAGAYWVAAYAGTVDEEKVFNPIEENWGKRVELPEPLRMARADMRKDRDMDAQYLACYPNGASDIGAIQVIDPSRGRKSFKIEVLGAMGQFEVKE